jgi:RNA polymerase sigma-70 factor, ECF subfamily
VTDLDWIEGTLTAARPRAVAALLRYFRDLDTAEEAVQNACLRALSTWPKNGPPRDPAAWLILVGRNFAVDTHRRAARQVPLPDDDSISDTADTETALAERLDGGITATTSCVSCSCAAIRCCRRPSRSRSRCASCPASR